MADVQKAAAPTLFQRAVQAVRYTITGAGPQGWFSPMQPLGPMAPPEVKGRQFDYQVGRNLNYRPRSEEAITFGKLRGLAEYGIIRTIIKHQKDLIEAFDWNVVPRETAPGVRPAAGKYKAQIQQVEAFLAYPDRVHDWPQWIRGLLEEAFVLDAVSIYKAPNRGGGLYALEIIAGDTIFPLLDASGRMPAAPDVAYQQILKGIPAADFSADELIYYPREWRPNHVYGQSPVQMIVRYAEAEINRLTYQSAYFTNGNLPDGFFTLPADFTNDQIKQWQAYWDDAYSRIEERRHGMFTPNGTTWTAVKPPDLKDDFDEWLARVACFCFSTSPQPFIKAMSRGNQEAQQEVAESGGILTYLAFIKRLMNRVIQNDLGCPDLEFGWLIEKELDLLIAEQMDDLALRNGSKVIDEVRDRRGEDPYPDGMGSKPLIYTSTGAVRVEDAIKEPEPPPPALVHADPNSPPDPNADKPQLADQKPPAKVAKRAPLKAPAPVPTDSPQMRTARAAMEPKVTKALKKAGSDIAAQVHREMLKLGKAADDSGLTADQIAAALAMSGFDVLPEQLAPILGEVASTAGQSVLVQLDLTGSDIVNQVDRRSLAFARSRAAEMVGKVWEGGVLVDNPDADWAITETTREMLRSAIADGLSQNLSADDLQKVIQDSYAFSADRARVITATEVAKANVQGALDGAREAAAQGVVLKKVWLTSNSDNCCDDCTDNEDDGPIELDESFSSGDDAPPGHPNCQCSISWEVE